MYVRIAASRLSRMILFSSGAEDRNESVGVVFFSLVRRGRVGSMSHLAYFVSPVPLRRRLQEFGSCSVCPARQYRQTGRVESDELGQ